MTTKADFIPAKRFFDNKNFPHGFDRSGDFTVKESTILTTYGTRLNQLSTGVAKPENKVEENFLKAFYEFSETKEIKEGLTYIEKTWFKYWKLSHEFKRIFSVVDRIFNDDEKENYNN